MRVLVTGGSGLIGRNVVTDLTLRHEVRVLDLLPPPCEDCEFFRGDVGRPEDLRRAMDSVEAVVHIAGGHQSSDPYKVMHFNAMCTFNVLEVMAALGIKRLVYASSDSAFGLVFRKTHFCPPAFPISETLKPRPQDAYGLAKLLAEEMCRGYTEGYGIRTICLRHCWVWWKDAPHGNPYRMRPEIAARGADGSEQRVNIGRLWGYVDMSDVVSAYRSALGNIDRVDHEVVFLSASDTFSDRESIDLIRECFPETRDVSDEYRVDPYKSLFDIAKAKHVLGWEPSVSWREVGT